MPRIEDYDYFLPPELVAQYPLGERDASRLLVLHRDGGEIRHAGFRELAAALDENDVLVVNDTRVFPARLLGHKDSGGKVELLLHHLPEVEAGGAFPQAARARATHRGHLKIGQSLNFGAALTAAVLALPEPGVAEVRFTAVGGDPVAAVLAAGEVPLPPYIHRPATAKDQETYQTVFAAAAGAVACPTAGLHFTGAVLADLARRGVEIVRLTLHVGPGTFMPVRVEDYTRHRMAPEYFELSEAAAARLNTAKAAGKRVVAVGTTSVRVLESCASPQGFKAQQGWCGLFSKALMEEIARLEDLAREWIGLFPQAGLQGQHWQKVLSQVQAHVAEDTCRLAAVSSEIRQEHHDQRPGGPGPFAPGRRISRPWSPGSNPARNPGRCSRSRGGTRSTGKSAGPWGCPNPRLVDRAAPLDLQASPDRELLARSWPRPGKPNSGPAAAWIRTTCC